MASADRISDIIDDKVYDQIDKLIGGLKSAQDELAKTSRIALEAGQAVSSSKSYKEFEENLNKASEAQNKLRKSRADAAIAEERLRQLQQRAIDQAEKRLKKEQEIEAKNLARLKRQEEAEARFAARKINLAGEVEDKTIKSVVNETEARKALADAEAMEITLEAQKRMAKEQTAQATKRAADEEERAVDILDKYSGTLKEQIAQNVSLKTQLRAVQTEIKEANKSQASSIETKRRLAEQELELKEAVRVSNLELNRSVREQNAAEGSSDKLSARLDRLRAAYRALNDEERNNVQIGGVLLAQIQDLDKETKKLDASQGVFNRFVGEYGTWGKSLESIFPAINQINSALKVHEGILKSTTGLVKDYVNGTVGMTTSQKAAAAATTKTSTAMKILRAALISTGIGALVVALGSLVAYFTSTQEGINKVRAATTLLKTAMSAFLGVLQDVGGWLVSAFENPKKAMKDVADFVKDNLINRFKALGVIIEAISNRDFKKLADGVVQLGTGIADVTGKSEKFFGGILDKSKRINELHERIERAEVDLIKRQAELNREYKIQSELAADISAPEEERRKAAEEAIRITNEQLSLEKNLIDMRIERMKLEKSMTDTTIEDEKELAELEAERINFEAKASEARLSARRRLNSIDKQIAAKAEEEHKKRIKEAEELAKAEIDLAIQRARFAQERSNEVVNEERNAFEDRIDNLEYYYKKQEEIINLEYSRQLIGTELQGDALTKLEEKRTNDLENLLKDRAKRISEVINSTYSEEDRTRAERHQKILDQMELDSNAEIMALNARYAAGEIGEKEYQERRLEIQRKYTRDYVNAEIKAVEDIIEINKKRGVDTESQELELSRLKVKLSEETTKEIMEDNKKLEEQEREIAEVRKQLLREIHQLANQLVTQYFENEDAKLEKEKEGIDIRAERDKENVERTILDEDEKARRIAVIERRAAADREKIEQKQRENQLKQAKFEKTAALIQAGIQTALAVTKALATGPPQGFILAALVAALGAVQIAAIASKPLPKYFACSAQGSAW